MSHIICVTNRALCEENFLVRLEKIASAHPAAIVLREKDLPPEEYADLAKSVLKICEKFNVRCILHTFFGVATDLGAKAIHLPMHVLRSLSNEQRKYFSDLGASCHSVEEAIEAERLGCTYITAGHVFDTDCKRGAPGRGLVFLRKVTAAVSIPVYAIGGMSADNYAEVIAAGAEGACVMSGAMTCPDPEAYFKEFKA